MTKKKDSHLKYYLKLTAKTSIIIFVSSIICKILTYFYRIIIARHFGSEIYGLFSIALMLFGVFAMFSLAGMTEGVVRYISYYRGIDDKRKIKQIFKLSLQIALFTSIIAGFIMFLSSEFFAVSVFHNSKLTMFFQLLSIAVPFFAISQMLIGTMRAFEKISALSIIGNIIEPSIKIFMLAILIFLGFNYSNSISFSIIAGYLGTLIFSYLFCRLYLLKLFIHIKDRKDNKLTKEFFTYSLPLLFSSLIAFVFGQVSIFALGYFKSAREVGIYDAALSTALMLTLTPALFTLLFFPIINKEYSRKNLFLIKELSKQVAKWIFIINLPAIFIFLFFPGAVINLLFGQAFIEGGIVLSILAVGLFILTQSEISQNLLGMVKKTNIKLFNITFIFILTIILNIYFIPMNKIWFIENPSGITGAAIASLLAFFVYGMLINLEAYYYTRIIPLRRKMLNVLLSCIISGALLLIARNFIEVNTLTLVLIGSLFLLVYSLLIILTKSFDKNDIEITNSLRRKIFKKPRLY